MWSVESLPSNLVARILFPAGSDILIFILDVKSVYISNSIYVVCSLIKTLGVRPLCSVLWSCAVSGGDPAILLTMESERPALMYV